MSSQKVTSGTYIFWLVMCLVFGLGAFFLFLSATHLSYIETSDWNTLLALLRSISPDLSLTQAETFKAELDSYANILQQESLLSALLRDFGIAAIVAVLLTISIEFYARNRLQDEIRSGVIEAAFKRLIPGEVFEEIKKFVIGAPCVKRDWRIAMMLRTDEEVTRKFGPNHFVSHTTLQYTLLNITSSVVKQDIHLGLDEDVTGTGQDGLPLPRYEKIQIGELEIRDKCIREYLSENDQLEFIKEYSLQPGQITVICELHEIIRVPNTFVWSTPIQTEGTTITIDTSAVPCLSFSVIPLHPDRARLEERIAGHSWSFSGGVLPWQGFQITGHLMGDSPETVRDDIA